MTTLSPHQPPRGANAHRMAAWLCLVMSALTPVRAEVADTVREPVLRIRASGTFDIDAARTVRAGDSVVYRLSVVWNEVPAAVRLSPREALNAPGFKVASSSVSHLRTSSGGEVENRTDYVYVLVPQDPGTARIAALTVNYHNGLTGREEEIRVTPVSLAVAPAAVPLRQRPGVLLFFALAAAALLAAFALGVSRYVLSRKHPIASAPSPKNTDQDHPEASALASLRSRCDGADSRVWLNEAERLCISWLCRQLGITHPGNVRFEAALDQYLSRKPCLPLPVRESWITLRDLFHETRYAPVRREPHELHAIHRHLKTCLLPDGP